MNVFAYVSNSDAARELATAAQVLATSCGADIPVRALSPEGARTGMSALHESFAEVWNFDLGYPNAEIVRQLLVKVLPPKSILLLPHDTFAIDLAPGLSVKLGVPYVPDVVGFDGNFIRQEFAGQVSTHVKCDVSNGAVITIRSGAFRPAEPRPASGVVTDRSADAAGITAKRRFVELIQAESGDIDITREDVLVSVGRGIGDKDNLPLVEELAEAMGAAVACSRPIVDAKWLDRPRQVGTSGKTVKPKVYLALGISGSFQHLGGIKGNPFLLAVNKNPKAPIFQAATVGVVADLLELLPVLTEKVRAAR